MLKIRDGDFRFDDVEDRRMRAYLVQFREILLNT